MLETDIGGRFVVNYTYTNTEGEDSTTFSLAVEANYEGIFNAGASSNTGYGQNSKMTNSNTKISGYTRGGNGAAFSTMEEAIQSMKDWTISLDDETKWSLIDSPSTITEQDECTGIWLFADSEGRKNEIHNKYIELLQQNEASIASVQTAKWIKNIYLWDSDVLGEKSFKDMKLALHGEIPNAEIKFAGENSAAFEKLAQTYTGAELEKQQNNYIKQFDLMSGAGNNYVYMIFEYTTNKDEALRGVYGNSSGKMSNTKNINYRYEEKDSKIKYDTSLWSIVRPIDSDDDDYCGGDKTRVIFKSYKQNRNGTKGANAYPIKEIAVYNKSIGKTSAATMISRWKISSEGDGIDIGKDAGGDYIYLRIYYDEEDLK